MRLDRKFLLIAPTLVLVLIVGGMFFIGTQLEIIVAASDSWRARDAFVTAVEKGDKKLSVEQAVGIVRYSLDAEQKRTAAIVAVRQTLIEIAWMALLCTGILLWTIRGVRRTLPLRGKVLFSSAPAPGES